MPAAKKVKPKPLPSVKRSLFWAVGLYVWDIFISGLPVIGLVVAAIAFVAYAIFALYRNAKQERDLARRYAWRGMVYLVTVVAIVSSHGLNLKMGARNAEQIIVAVENYYQDKGQFPEDLEMLVPDYLDRIPKSAVRLSANEYRYWAEDGRYALMWIKAPPYLRAFYDFERKEWTIID
jgi:hypothetical protein